MIVTVLVEVAAVHEPLGLPVSVKVTTPVSPDPGAYVGVNVLALKIVPVPVVVQRIDAVLLDVAPPAKVMFTPWQVDSFEPALTEGDAVIVIVFVAVTDEQEPFPVPVSVNVTVPVSPAPGV